MSTERITDQVSFAYWVPNISGGLVTSDIEQRTSWDDERYRRSAEFLEVIRKIWTEDAVNYGGDSYRIRDFTLKPKPLNTSERPNPELFQGGNSTAARRNGGRHADWYFSNGKDFDGVTEQLNDLREVARANDREVKFGLNGFIIARTVEKEARDTLR